MPAQHDEHADSPHSAPAIVATIEPVAEELVLVRLEQLVQVIERASCAAAIDVAWCRSTTTRHAGVLEHVHGAP